jgi:TolB-like protein/Tfp pilus assembly protein PilF
MESFWQRLRSRKLVEWTIAYLAGAFALLQVVDIMRDAFSWPTVLLRVLTVVVGFGFGAVLVLAWYHGEKGHQRMPTGEVVLLSIIGLLTVGGSWYAAVTAPPAAQPTASQPVPDPPAGGQLVFDPATAAHSVAVLPFDNMTPNEQNDYLTEGITEDIITELGKTPELRVISRTSTMRYRDTDKSMREIGAELGVASILEGSVRVQGNRVRIVAQLIDVATDGHIWADTFDRDLKDIFAVQSEVARAIASALRGELVAPPAVVAGAELPATDPETYRLYSKGKSLAGGTEDDRSRAVEYLDSAVQRDPRFAPALNALANVQTPMVLDLDPTGQIPAAERVMNVATRALELNPASSEARSALAFMRAFRSHDEQDLQAAEASARQAVESNPNSVPARMRHAQILYSQGNSAEAMRELAAAAALDPMSAMVHGQMGEFALSAGQLADAEVHFRKAIQLDSMAASHHVSLGMLHIRAGRTDDAVRELETAARLRPNDPGVLGSLASTLAQAGRAEEAQRIADQLARQAGEGKSVFGVLAQVYTALGQPDKAVDWLKKGASDERHNVYLFSPRFRYTLETLREDPRTAKVLDSLGIRVEIRRVTPDSARAPRRPSPPGSRSRSEGPR